MLIEAKYLIRDCRCSNHDNKNSTLTTKILKFSHKIICKISVPQSLELPGTSLRFHSVPAGSRSAKSWNRTAVLFSAPLLRHQPCYLHLVCLRLSRSFWFTVSSLLSDEWHKHKLAKMTSKKTKRLPRPMVCARLEKEMH